MKTSDFDYNLPDGFIAQKPVTPRDHSKMLFYDRKSKSASHKRFYDLTELLSDNDVLILNKSKVIPARLIFKYDDREREIFLLNDLGSFKYETIVRPGKFFKVGNSYEISKDLSAIVEQVKEDGTRIVQFSSDPKNAGEVPLPPYIKNPQAKFEDYQTVYASSEGSVAAPTAGLHFTNDLIKKLLLKGVKIEYITLHVGRGTFLPVKSENIKDHKMHSEYYELDSATCSRLNQYKSSGKNIIAVGTTSVRTLESSFVNGRFEPLKGETDIFIYPGYKWKAVDSLITNFHLPKSTLLMLVSSFLGSIKVMKDLYKTAVENKYRFYSFGDCMFLR